MYQISNFTDYDDIRTLASLGAFTSEPERSSFQILNENMKAIRKSKGLSQQELTVKLNVVRQTVSKWEQGI